MMKVRAEAFRNMSEYYRRTGVSQMGGNSRTRGRPAPIRQVVRERG